MQKAPQREYLKSEATFKALYTHNGTIHCGVALYHLTQWNLEIWTGKTLINGQPVLT